MRRLLLPILLAAGIVAGGHPPRASAAPGCTKVDVFVASVQAGIATAPDQIQHGVCGAFLGPGSRAMAVVRTGRGCGDAWSVLAFSDGAWHTVSGPWDRGARMVRLAAAGDAIRERRPVFRSSDHGCRATGGSRARLWRWNGARLAAGRWRPVAVADAAKPARAG